MLYTLVLFASSILASSRPICKAFRCNNPTWNGRPGWCGLRCKNGRQKPETPVDVPPPPPVAHVPSVLTPPSEWHEPNEPLLCTSEPQAANDAFVRTSQDESGLCLARPCRDGPQKPETLVDEPNVVFVRLDEPNVVFVRHVFVKPSETLVDDQTLIDEIRTLLLLGGHKPNKPFKRISVPQAANNVVFVRTSQDGSGAHAQWPARMRAVASALEDAGATPVFADQIIDSEHLCTILSHIPDYSISYLQISEHGNAAGRTGLLGDDHKMKKLGDLLRQKLAPKAKIFLDSCNSGKTETGSATLLSNHLNENHEIVGPSKNLPPDGVRLVISSGQGEELVVELDDELKREDEKNFKKANEMLSLFEEHIQQILLMDENDVSTSVLARNLGLFWMTNEARLRSMREFIRENLTPLQLVKYNGKRK